jgi:predicted transcriptional regulator
MKRMKHKSTPTTRPIPVRLHGETCDRLDKVAQMLCANRALIMRLAITQILPDLEAGRLILKPAA